MRPRPGVWVCMCAWGSRDAGDTWAGEQGQILRTLSWIPSPGGALQNYKISSPKKQKLSTGKPAWERWQGWDSLKKAHIYVLKKRMTAMGAGGWNRIPGSPPRALMAILIKGLVLSYNCLLVCAPQACKPCGSREQDCLCIWLPDLWV